MERDVLEQVEPLFVQLASETQFRRLQLLLLREILVELRKLNKEPPRTDM